MSRQWVPFSHRYGFATWDEAAEEGGWSWRSRHGDDANTYDGNPLFRCACPASGDVLAKRRCSERATQEDRLCDACREHCWAVDSSSKYHRLIDVYGAAS